MYGQNWLTVKQALLSLNQFNNNCKWKAISTISYNSYVIHNKIKQYLDYNTVSKCESYFFAAFTN